MHSLSIVLPAFNEGDNIERAIEEVGRACDQLRVDHEIIVVDDGSSDATGRILDTCKTRRPDIRLLRHARNRGYGAALRSGIQASTREHIFFTDADLQFDVGEIERLLRWADRYDIIAGYRVVRADNAMRRVNAWAWGRLMDTLFDLEMRDIDCAFKLFHRRVFETIPIHSVGAFINSEILVRARAAGFTIHEVPVSHYPRKAGRPTGAHPRVVLKAIVEVVHMRRELRRASVFGGAPPSPPDRVLAGASSACTGCGGRS